MCFTQTDPSAVSLAPGKVQAPNGLSLKGTGSVSPSMVGHLEPGGGPALPAACSLPAFLWSCITSDTLAVAALLLSGPQALPPERLAEHQFNKDQSGAALGARLQAGTACHRHYVVQVPLSPERNLGF